MSELFASAPSVCWLALLIIFGALEGLTATLVCLWFAVGALAALLVSLLIGNLWVQAFTFAIVSLVTLILIRPMAQQLLRPKGVTATNADRLIGKIAVVTEPIDEFSGSGQVKISGLFWAARTSGGEAVPTGRRVKVLAIEGVKLIVEPVTNEAHLAP